MIFHPLEQGFCRCLEKITFNEAKVGGSFPPLHWLKVDAHHGPFRSHSLQGDFTPRSWRTAGIKDAVAFANDLSLVIDVDQFEGRS